MHPLQEHLSTLIFCHGLSDSANSYVKIFSQSESDEFIQVPYGCKIVLPTAPKRVCTCYPEWKKVNSWFDYLIEEDPTNLDEESLRKWYNQAEL